MIYRRHALSALCTLGGLALLGSSNATTGPAAPDSTKSKWPAWDVFRAQFISDGGRVIDVGSPRSQTFSEGQSYALFFSLIANDRVSFDKILQWTEDNLCKGDMTAHLPAWLWGRRDDNTWGILDDNPASDSNLWIAYALGEAGRLWNERRYRLLANLLIARILREETANLPGLGPCLLPASKHFEIQPGRWRLNPSYMPMHLMNWLAESQADPLWKDIAESSLKIITKSAPIGFVPDWILYDINKGFLPDLTGAEKGQGAYNAIRAYLWAGVLNTASPARQALVKALAPMGAFVKKNGYPPESIDILTGQAAKPGSTGFSAAVLPFLHALGDKSTTQTQLQRIQARPPLPDQYYAQVLSLFGLGWIDGVYRFTKNGQVQTRWKSK